MVEWVLAEPTKYIRYVQVLDYMTIYNTRERYEDKYIDYVIVPEAIPTTQQRIIVDDMLLSKSGLRIHFMRMSSFAICVRWGFISICMDNDFRYYLSTGSLCCQLFMKQFFSKKCKLQAG